MDYNHIHSFNDSGDDILFTQDHPKSDVTFIKSTDSLCPTCLKVIKATVYAKEGKVYIIKTCPEHGEFKDLYWGSYEEYLRAEEYSELGKKLSNPRTQTEKGCPFDCGICPGHKSHTVLAIIDVTNRCNLRCPICFAHAGAAGYLYEPTKDQIRRMLVNLRSNKPVKPPALQFSGGEPTVREDLPELVRMAKEMGFLHVEINSNGLKMADSLDYCKKLKDVGVDTIYLQFDGVTPEPYLVARGFDLYDIKIQAINNLRNAGFHSVALVPTLVKGVNDDQIGDILRFAIENRDVIRCVNFQPVSITGRISRRERREMRITIPDLMRLAEKQTNGLIPKSDWYPVPAAVPLTTVLGLLQNEEYIDLSCHPHCGMATYLVIDDEAKSIGEYLDIKGFIEDLRTARDNLQRDRKIRGRLSVIKSIVKNAKPGLFKKYLLPLMTDASFEHLSDLHHNMIMIGSMHFMDPYNFDVDRVQRCLIHYATPDGKIIPFCSMNTLHRRRVEKKFAKEIVDEELTPIYDIEGLKRRIKKV
jgi:hypothetical protein